MIEYTREWIKKVNRGGLFDINDQGYNLFLAIEVTRREKLTQHLEECILSSDSDERKSIWGAKCIKSIFFPLICISVAYL